MKPVKNTEKYVRIILLPLVAFMLVLSTVLPSAALAETETETEPKPETPIVVTPNPGKITQDDINTKTSTIKLTLENEQSWIADIDTQTLIGNMTADAEKDAWDTYKKGIHIARDSANEKVLIVTLPKAAYHITNNQTITMVLPVELIKDGQGPAISVTFDIEHSGTSILTVVPTSVTEKDIKTIGTTITLSLIGNKWSIDTEAKKQALIDALIAKDQPEQWKKVKDALTPNNVTLNGAANDTVIITIPRVADYELGTNQIISLNVPYQLLENRTTINEAELTIETIAKVLISGTVTPKVSQADIIKGGKTIIITLVNAKWDDAIATNTTLREKLLKGFKFGDDYIDTINIGANVVRTNDQVAMITLPPLASFKIATDTQIAFDENSITATETFTTKRPDAFTITPTSNQTAAISGSIVGASEFDIAQGEKKIIVTLKNDSWTTDLTALNKFKPEFEAEGDTPTPVNLTVKDVERTSDTVLTMTLQEAPGFTLTDDITVKLGIPADLLSNSGNPITTTAFKIAAVKAELPSRRDLVLDKVDIQNGGKTISITLKNATFKEDLAIDEALVDSIFGNSSSNWTTIITALKSNLTNISIRKNNITIKLPPVPDYDSLTADTLELKIPKDFIDHDKAKEIIVDGQITTGAVATATLNSTTFSTDQIKAGNETFKITLTGTEWDPTLLTNRNKKTALLRGFTVTDQTKEWALLSKEISSNAQFELSDDQKVISITLPAVSGYSIIRDQVVNINIPKSVLVNYKEDIAVADRLTITVPSTSGDRSLNELTAEELADAMFNNKRVIVPSKKIEVISVNTVELPGPDKEKQSITTIEVTAAAGVKKVQVTVNGTLRTATHSGDTQSKSLFVFNNLERNSELQVSVFGNNTEPLQTTYKKIGKGSKVYNEIPKKNLAGSYLLYDILMHKSLLKDILKHYSIDELKVTS